MIPTLPRRFLPLLSALAGLLLASGPAALHAEMRTLTDTQGRTLQAELVSVDGDNVTIKRSDGETFTLPLSSLSAGDQKDIKAWAAKHPSALPPGSVQLSYSRGQVFTEGKSTGKADAHAASQWAYTVSVFNRTSKPLAGVRVEYAIFLSSADAKSGKKPAPKSGSKSIDSIAMYGRSDFTTDAVTLAAPASSAKKGAPAKAAGPAPALRGIWLRVYVGDQLAAESCSPEDLSKTETWPAGKTGGSATNAKKGGKKNSKQSK